MADFINPFLTNQNVEAAREAGSMTKGAQRFATQILAQKRREMTADPVASSMKVLSQRKADLGRVKEALKNEKQAFIDLYGGDIFETDTDVLTGRSKVRVDEATKAPILKWGGEGSATRQMIQLREASGRDPGAKAELDRMESEFNGKQVRLTLEKWQRLQARQAEIDAADQETEGQLGALSEHRLTQAGVMAPTVKVGQTPQAVSAAPVPAPAPAQPVQPNVAAQPGVAAQAAGMAVPPAAATLPPSAQTAAAIGAAGTTAPAGESRRVTPMEIIRMHRQMKDAMAVAAMDTSTPELKQGQALKVEALKKQIADGMAALPSDGLRQRVIDHTRDPSFWEEVKNFVGRVGEGVGSSLVDAGEFAAVNTLRAVGAGQSDAADTVKEFAQAMREEAAAWGLDGVPKEVQEKLREGVGSTLGQGLGSTVAFMAPTMGALRIGKLLGASPKVLKAISVAVPGVVGAAQSSNSMEREAETMLAAELKAGKISREEYEKGVTQAAVLGLFVGGTEAISPLGRFSQKAMRVPAGRTFLRELGQKLQSGGAKTAVQWMRGNGRRFVVDVISETGEEAFQEALQGWLGNMVARGDFGNVAFDPERHLGEGMAEGAASGGAVGAIMSTILGIYAGGNVQRQKRIAAAMQKAAQAPATATQPPPAAPAGPTGGVGSTPPAGSAPGQSQPAQTPSGQTAQGSTTPAAVPGPDGSEPAAEDPPVQQQLFTFEDSQGKKVEIQAAGIKDAAGKLPDGFKPDLSKTRVKDLAPDAKIATPETAEGQTPLSKETATPEPGVAPSAPGAAATGGAGSAPNPRSGDEAGIAPPTAQEVDDPETISALADAEQEANAEESPDADEDFVEAAQPSEPQKTYTSETADEIPPKSEVTVTLEDGSTISGQITNSQGNIWIRDRETNTVRVLKGPAADTTSTKIEITETADSVIEKSDARKYGEIAYKQPTTRDEYESVLYDLARQAQELSNGADAGAVNDPKRFLRSLQIEAQFDKVADEIKLAKKKRKFIRFTAIDRAEGRPMRHPTEIMAHEGPNAAAILAVPRGSDFDPDETVRKTNRSPLPPHAYRSKGEIENLLKDARQRANRSKSQSIRDRFSKLAEKHAKSLEKRQYREAVEEDLKKSADAPGAQTAKGASTEAPPAPSQKRPLPEDISFLFEQRWTGKDGKEKVVRSFQVDRSPTNPRGRTVDEAALEAEGYDTTGLDAVVARTVPLAPKGSKDVEKLRAILKHAGLSRESRVGDFLADFLPRIYAMNAKAFEDLEIRSYNDADWETFTALRKPALRDSAAVYDSDSNVLHLNQGRTAGKDIIDAFIHETGHFAETFALGEDFTQNEWEKLTDEQRSQAWFRYSGDRVDGANLKKNRVARREWVAMQFARVVRGDTEQMTSLMIYRLRSFLTQVRELVRKWVGDESLSTRDLDAKILDLLGYSAEGMRAPTKFEEARVRLGKDATVIGILRNVVADREDVKNAAKNTPSSLEATVTSALREETGRLTAEIVSTWEKGLKDGLGQSWPEAVNNFSGMSERNKVGVILAWIRRQTPKSTQDTTKPKADGPLHIEKGENGMEARVFASTDPKKPGTFNVVLVDADAEESVGATTDVKTMDDAKRIAGEMLRGKKGSLTPRRGVVGGKLEGGERVTTSSGRLTSPFPEIRSETNRKMDATLKRVDFWLLGNAIEEAQARKDEFNLNWMSRADPTKLSQSDKDSLEEYLFGEQPKVLPPLLKPFGKDEPVSKPQKAPATAPTPAPAKKPGKYGNLSADLRGALDDLVGTPAAAEPAIEELSGKRVVLTGLTPAGEQVQAEMDAAEAWTDTKKRLAVLNRLMECVKR